MAKVKKRKRAKTILSQDKLMTALKKGEILPVYHFRAADKALRSSERNKKSPFNDYLLDRALDQIRKLIVDGNTNDFNYGSFVAGDTPMDDVIAIAGTYPMMRERRLVIVKDAHNYLAGDWKSALSYLADPSPQTCLVFIGEHFPTANKGGEAAQQAILEYAACVLFSPFRNMTETLPHLQAACRERGLKLQQPAERALIDLIGFDLNLISQALNKLELYAEEGAVITVKDVEQCIAQTRVEDIWGFQDSLAERRLGPALEALGRLQENSKQEDQIQLIGSLISLFGDLVRYRRLLDAGVSVPHLVNESRGNSWAVEKRVKQAKRNSLAALTRSMMELHRLDRSLRSGPAPKQAYFERFVMKACQA